MLVCKAQVGWTGVQVSNDARPPALQGCRPCKMFSRKYQRMAEQFQECIFLDIVGDESTDTRVSAVRPESIEFGRHKSAREHSAV